MSDSVLVVIGGEAAAGFAELPVVPDADREREQALADARPDAIGCADAAERAVARLLVAAVGAQQRACQRAHDLLELFAREAFVADDELVAVERAGAAHAVEQRGGDLALGLVGGGEAEAVRHPVRGADEVEPEAPEVRGAVAVGGVAGKLGTLDRLPRLRAR